MITIAVLTATRAEYGLMRPLIKRLREDDEIELKLLVTGTHLSEKYGMTYHEIEQDGNEITAMIPILSDKKGACGISETMANAMIAFTDYFTSNKIDYLLVDGDRYETLAICIAAVNANVPIIHVGGGETTEGAADECYRHAISKMSFLHFAITESYRNRIIQMGESPDRVWNVGSLGVENIKKMNILSKSELEKQINFELDKPYGVVTFHPVTLENNTAEKQTLELLKACDMAKDMKFIFTKANADRDGEIINELLDKYAENNRDRILCVDSLGVIRYLAALKYAEFVLGNSSSGIIEAPSMGIPTINIGDRQRGRIQAQSIINCEPNAEAIYTCIGKAREKSFQNFCKTVINPNGDGNASEKIVNYIKAYIKSEKQDIKKKFYNIEWN